MNLAQDAVKEVIARVLNEMAERAGAAPAGANASSLKEDGMYDDVDQAVTAAKEAQKRLLSRSLEERKAIVDAVRRVTLEHNRELAELAVRETGLGRVEDKVKENELAAKYTPGVEELTPKARTGDSGLTLLEYAPVGVIGALTPVTNSTGTLINNTISMVSAGNTVVYNCHPTAVGVTRRVMALFNRAMIEAGGFPGLVTAMSNPTLETADRIMKHPDIRMLVATGGPHVVRAVLSSGKKAIGAGAGNPPALVDETAALKRAAQSIVDGHSINNNIFCISEKEVIVVDEVADILLRFMAETGKALVLTPAQAAKVCRVVLTPEGKINSKYIGKNVQLILEAAGIPHDEDLRCAVFEAPADHPLVWKEQMMPILPVVRVPDVWKGIELAVQVEQGNRHTAIMHSTNIDNLTAFARAVQTTIFVKNGPSYAGLGLGGEGHPSFTIAGPTGEGLTSPISFTRQRRCTLVDSFRIV